MSHRGRNALAISLILALLCAHAILAWSAASQKSATVDEPTHLMAAFMNRWYGDDRIDPTNPPLWTSWVALNLPRSLLKTDTSTPAWPMLLHHVGDEWQWYSPVLYRTPGNDPARAITRARLMMLPIALAVGVLIARWAWVLAGPTGAVAATILWALDPNFLAHGPLVKNDVAAALCLAGVALATWRLGQRVTLWRVIVLTLWCGAGLATKLTGVLAFPIVAVLLAFRVVLSDPWLLWRRSANRIFGKASIAIVILVVVTIGSWAILWASYGFRYGSNDDPQQWIDLPSVTATAQRMQNGELGLADRAVLWANDHRLMPLGWTAGFIYVGSYNHHRPAYLLGQSNTSGWWYYFPLAILFKTPLATLVAGTAAILVFMVVCRPGGGRSPSPRTRGEGRGEGDFECNTAIGSRNHPHPNPLPAYVERGKSSSSSTHDIFTPDRWAMICLLGPVFLFSVFAAANGQNVGVRHIFPIAPPLFVMIGIAVATAVERWPKSTCAVGCILAAALAAETLAAYPNFIPFFNIAAGGSHGGLRLLSDSNLDWGQDLRPLAKWRESHPGGMLYLDYLGTADPAYYLGRDYVPLSAAVAADPQWATHPGYLAVSATHLQGLYVPLPVARMYRQLMLHCPPVAIIGGSIYVYRLPL